MNQKSSGWRGFSAIAAVLAMWVFVGCASERASKPDAGESSVKVFTPDECLKSFEIDPRLSLCHVWPTIENSRLIGFVEQPQYKAVLERATKMDVAKIKLLPEDSKTDARFGIVKADHAILHEDPIDPPGDRDNVSDLLLGEPVWILDRASNGWLLVHSGDGYLGWVHASAIDFVEKDAIAARLNQGRTPSAVQRADAILDQARSLLRVPYLWGGKTRAGIDCSGFVQVSFASRGILLPRDADQQANVGKLVATRWFKDALLPGDLLFFVSEDRGNVHHVAIYIGNGKFIHAQGDNVHISSFNQSDAEYDADRARAFAWARRVIE